MGSKERCAACSGFGKMDGRVCTGCSGRGFHIVQTTATCGWCNGSGHDRRNSDSDRGHYYRRCPVCNGTGVMRV